MPLLPKSRKDSALTILSKREKAGERQHCRMLHMRKALKISYLLSPYLSSIYFPHPTCPFWRPLIPSLERPVAKHDSYTKVRRVVHIRMTPSGCRSCLQCSPSLCVGVFFSTLLGDGWKHNERKKNQKR